MTKAAKILSVIFHPVFVTLYCMVTLYITTDIADTLSTVDNILVFSLIISFTIIVPCLAIWILYTRGKISDLNLSVRHERTPIYLISMTSALVCAYLMFAFLDIYFFVFFWVFAILSVALTALVNLWWKISIHSCGMGILCSFMVLMSMLYSIDILWLCGSLFVAGSVMTSRCLLGAHTVEQTLTGFGVGLGFGLIPLGLLLCVINNFLTFAAC